MHEENEATLPPTNPPTHTAWHLEADAKRLAVRFENVSACNGETEIERERERERERAT
jgi:hypothetical protein